MKKELRAFELFKHISPLKRIPLSIGLEITSRCNLNCRHCYINKPASDKIMRSSELTFKQIDQITDEALKLGTLWIHLTGGEALLRDDFIDIYLCLKRKGFLVSVLTNGTLITEKHIEIFKKYPPRSLEISIYGMTEKTCEFVTQTKGALKSFQKGFELCVNNGFDIILKTVASRPIMPELDQIKNLAMKYENVILNIEDSLISRIDNDYARTKMIQGQRSPKQLKASRPKTCEVSGKASRLTNDFQGNLFLCNAGINSCWISSDGKTHLCTTLRNPELAYDLKSGTLNDYWKQKVPEILSLRSERLTFKENCGTCTERSSCLWCPALSWVETREMDQRVDHVCTRMTEKKLKRDISI